MLSLSSIFTQSLQGIAGGGTQVYSTIASLPLSGNETGAQAFVEENNRLYIWNGVGWFNIALINTNPTITQGPDPSYVFATDGTPIVITLLATDPEEVPITWSFEVTDGTLGDTATISQDDNVFTITPSTNEGDDGTFSITFTASDGVNVATAVSSFTLAFVVDIVPLLAVAHESSPFITIYNQEIDTFTKLANPATLPTGTGNGVAFSSDDTYMAVGHGTTPFITIYKRDGDTFTKLSNPATLPAGIGFGVAFSSDDTYMAVAHGTSPFITIYKRSGDTFTKLADPSTIPTGTGNGVAFSSDDTYMAVGHGTTPFITIYKRSGDTFTKLSNPATLPAGIGFGVAFSNTGFPQ